MPGGFTRFFLIPATAGVLTVAIVVVGWWWGYREADAQVALLYPKTCLGGWKNPDRVTGPPDVTGRVDAEYGEHNAAHLDGITTQLFCSGFEGELPVLATYARVSVHFSWQADTLVSSGAEPAPPVVLPEVSESVVATTTVPEVVPVGEEVFPAESSSEEPSQVEGQTSLEAVSELEPLRGAPDSVPLETAPDPEAILEPISSLWQHIPWLRLPTALAAEAESVSSDTIVSASEPTGVGESQDSDSPLLEVSEEGEEREVVQGVTSQSETPLTNPQPPVVSTTTGESRSSLLPDTPDQASVGVSGGEEVSHREALPAAVPGANDEIPLSVTDSSSALSPNDPLFLVRFTADGKSWHDLGYVSEIRNDLSFELPREVLATVPDLRFLQIALVSMPRFENPPPLWLDAIWIEVAYDVAAQDPMSPPGTVPGDLIVSEFVYDEYGVVTVLRGLSLSALSHVLAHTAPPVSVVATSSKNITDQAVVSTTTEGGMSSVATSTENLASSVVASPVGQPDLSGVALRALRQTPGVRQEIWLRTLLDQSWVLVAGSSMLAEDPHVTMIAGNVFWIGTHGASVWRYNPAVGSYDSRTISADDAASSLWFYDSATEPVEIYYRADRGRFEVRSRE